MVERVGLCLLIACSVAVILSFILISRGESALLLTLVCLGCGLLGGILVGWMMRPSLFDTAVEVDRQLHLADLLATALSIQKQKTVCADSFDEQWSTTIVAMAEARCTSIEGESLALRRLGAGTWGGVGLFTALVLTIGFLSANPLVPQALGFSAGESQVSESQKQSLGRDSRRVVDPKDTPDAESADRSRIESKTESASRKESAHGDSSSNSIAANNHGGVGSARTTDGSANNQNLAGVSDAKSSQTGVLANGGGRASDAGRAGDGSSSGVAGLSANRLPAPWKTDGWRAAQGRADEEIRAGEVPDAYRDLVHDYFDRKAP